MDALEINKIIDIVHNGNDIPTTHKNILATLDNEFRVRYFNGFDKGCMETQERLEHSYNHTKLEERGKTIRLALTFLAVISIVGFIFGFIRIVQVENNRNYEMAVNSCSNGDTQGCLKAVRRYTENKDIVSLLRVSYFTKTNKQLPYISNNELEISNSYKGVVITDPVNKVKVTMEKF